jgi:transcriptional regulator GlxA family with amidase domain
MSVHKESAVADDPLEVLFALHPKFNLMDFAGPWEVFKTALHDLEDSGMISLQFDWDLLTIG